MTHEAGRQAMDLIPEQLYELTSAWLTEALRETGELSPTSTVTSVEQELLGEGEGFMGVIARLRMQYEGEAGPASVIAKFPSLANRAIGEATGVYERENCFYAEFSAQTPVSVPQLYYGDFDQETSPERQSSRAALANYLPMWMLPSAVRIVTWIASRKKRRYILLIEDLEGTTPGDQVAGTTPERCADVLNSVARMHAAFWDDSRLQGRYWLTPLTSDLRVRHSVYLQTLTTLRERAGESLSAHLRHVIAWLAEHGVAVFTQLQQEAPPTLLHGDLRLDNMAFRGDDPVLFDWQAVRHGPATYDVAYFLSGACPTLTSEQERDLLRGYHNTLLEHGVRDYSFEQCWRHYELSMLATAHWLGVLTMLDIGEGRGLKLASTWLERIEARLRDVDPRNLLPPATS